ncbi:MAG: hypothetical protein EKK37_01335 [Sphingobacteriales bacterium]|nr:MAG: hypothetical protein EKK37_01335 [Sphingobacteriales bacterium]
MKKIVFIPVKSRTITISALIVCTVSFFTMCMDKREAGTEKKIEYKDFVGSESCKSCHKNIYDTHINTAHYHTSELPTEKSIKGNFEPGSNFFPYDNGSYTAIEKTDSGFFQVEYFGIKERQRHPFDIVTGSGTKGQTYLWWDTNKLFQLPITYFTQAHQWCNSPGFPERAVFKRIITSRCLECHATFISKISPPEAPREDFDKKTIIYGVDCERCHGPAAQHVNYQTQHPKDSTAKFIINPAKFARQQSLDLCALCHGGSLQKTKPSFSFVAGDKLSDFFTWDTTVQSAANIDVHGNQLGLLKFSQCFIQNNSLTCTSCHNPHQNQKNELTVFSQKCMGCHNKEHNNFCTVKVDEKILQNNCIDCHMPKQASTAIAVFLPGQSVLTPSLIRTHLIKKYPEETAKYLSSLKHAEK